MYPRDGSGNVVSPVRVSLAGPAERVLVAEEVQRAYRDSRYLPLRAIRCDYHEGVLTLRGNAPTYYLKQVAQTIALRVAGVDEVANRIEVGSPGR